MKYKITTQSPDQLSENEFGDFIALILAGGEVERAGLEDRVRRAKQLIILRVAGCLAGIGALKKPNAGHRKRVACLSGVDLPATEYPMELGWVFVLPNYRGNGYANRITKAAISVANGVGIFATSRSDNVAMRKALEKHGFVPTGNPYPSERGDHELRLFVRNSSQQCTPAEADTSRG